MGTECQLDCSDEDDKMLDEARERGVVDWSPETYEECRDVIEQAREDFNRAIEEIGREDLTKEQAERDEKNPEYLAKLQETTGLKVSEDHQLLIKGFNASRINNEDTARVQALFPAIVSQVAKEMEFTGKLPTLEMDERGKIQAKVETWNHEEGRAIGEFYRHTAEMKFSKSEAELNPEQKDKLTQEQMDTQLHWNFHTIHNILFTDEDRVEVERICYDNSQINPGWEEKVSEYAGEKAKEGRNDEVFCEFGTRLMTDVRPSTDESPSNKPDTLRELNPELYDFTKDRLERLSRLSETLGLKIREIK